ncbi:hypothetical protein [Maridesulfovibrio sp. FT414]|uniref:hypothetical protein n=1 Tax=Maridesulfovibrio sp. FT414 TaxID=2979469 RepID=UPI003D8052BE
MRPFVLLVLMLSLVIGAIPVMADDYDDGIGEGDGIVTGDNDLQKVTNMKFYNAKAKAKVYTAKKNKGKNGNTYIESDGSGEGGASIASPTFQGPVHGDVIIQMDAKDITIMQGN